MKRILLKDLLAEAKGEKKDKKDAPAKEKDADAPKKDEPKAEEPKDEPKEKPEKKEEPKKKEAPKKKDDSEKPEDDDKVTDILPGGKADGKSIQDIADKHKIPIGDVSQQLTFGIAHEMEHTKDRQIATEIAMDHLIDHPYYYAKGYGLPALEKLLKAKLKKQKEDGVKENISESSYAPQGKIKQLMDRLYGLNYLNSHGGGDTSEIKQIKMNLARLTGWTDSDINYMMKKYNPHDLDNMTPTSSASAKPMDDKKYQAIINSLETSEMDGGSAWDVAQNVMTPSIEKYLKRKYPGEDPMQRLTWDIEALF